MGMAERCWECLQRHIVRRKKALECAIIGQVELQKKKREKNMILPSDDQGLTSIEEPTIVPMPIR